MKSHALSWLVCLQFAQLSWAAFSRNDGEDRHSHASVNQPSRLEADAADGRRGRRVSLLEIVRGIQTRPPATVALEVQTQRRDQSGQSMHERVLLSDMGHLEDQLQSWKAAEKNLEHQMADQAKTMELMKAEGAKAIRDSTVAAMVWWDLKMLLCLTVVISIGLCIYSASPASCPRTPKSNAAEPVQPLARKVRAQAEFIEKDAKPEAEDALLVTLPSSHPAEKNIDLESATASFHTEDVQHSAVKRPFRAALPSKSKENVENSMHHVESDNTKCQFFALAEEDPYRSPRPVAQPDSASAEEAWWGDSSGY